ncbi:MAG: helix-turn-helix transcriptional regulator [Dehalococcoidia bacterium]|nr:helix-turn-helix transcriptional regulator [Dehalococcoidia bacterium]
MERTPSTQDQLTRREREIFALAASGATNAEIADELGVSRNAVRYALKEIHGKLDTEGDRRKLTWRRWRPLFGLFGVPAGLKGAVATGGALAAIGAASVGVYLAYPGGQQGVADGRQPNGCPESYSAWPGATLADFIEIGQTDRATVLRLNPGLADGPLAPGTEVRLPYNPNTTCALAEPTITPAPVRP